MEKKEKYILLHLTPQSKNKILDKGRINIFKIITREFLEELKKEKKLNFECIVYNNPTKLHQFRTEIFIEDLKKLRKLSKMNGISLTALENVIINKYL